LQRFLPKLIIDIDEIIILKVLDFLFILKAYKLPKKVQPEIFLTSGCSQVSDIIKKVITRIILIKVNSFHDDILLSLTYKLFLPYDLCEFFYK